MKNDRIQAVVADLLANKHEQNHTQTIKITPQAHRRLQMLAERLSVSKSHLANLLLEAAINDAIEIARSNGESDGNHKDETA